MKWRVNDVPIRSKFILQFLLGVLLPIAVLLIYVLTNVTAEIRRREFQNAEQSLDRIYTSLETSFSQTVVLSNAISADSALSASLRRSYASPAAYYAAYCDELRPVMNRYLYAYVQLITNIEIYTDNPTIFNGGYFPRIDATARAEEWFPDPLPATPTLVSYVRQQPGMSTRLQLCIVSKLDPGVPFAQVLKLDLNMDLIHSMVEQENAYLSVYLVAPDGSAVSYPGSRTDSMIAKRATLPPAATDLVRAFGASTAMRGWKVSANLNPEPMARSIRDAVWVGLLLGSICSLFAGGFSLLFARSIVLRSQRLLRHMDSVTAEHFLPITRNIGKDEIGELIEHYNTMGERLKQLIHDLYVLQLHQKSLELENVRAELKYLQAQIDPHFLFNTLNAILVTCVRNGYTEVADIISPLSKLLRRMVDNTRDVLPLREELQFVRMALKIEQFRFGEKLQYELDVAEEALERPVPVMCVQSLVENACKHGIQHLNGRGLIQVKARIEGDALVISVRDNGVGIHPRLLEDLQKRITSPEDMQGSIGLQNIYRRLKLYYGQSASLTLQNASERGADVRMRIPLNASEKGA